MNYFRTAEYYLYNFKALAANLEIRQEKLRKYEYSGLTVVDLTRPGSRSDFKTSITETEALNALKVKERLRREIAQLELKLNAIKKALACLEPSERRVVEHRYLEKLPWPQVAAKAGYSESSCFRIRKKAINTVSVALFGERALPAG